jgi:hypothetical protein
MTLGNITVSRNQAGLEPIMPYVNTRVDELLGKPLLGDGECVQIVKTTVPGLVDIGTMNWKEGEPVLGAKKSPARDSHCDLYQRAIPPPTYWPARGAIFGIRRGDEFLCHGATYPQQENSKPAHPHTAAWQPSRRWHIPTDQ